MSSGAPPGEIRLADLLAGLSLISDLGLGLPAETAMRSCTIGTALARRLGLDDATAADVFYVALLQHIGCTGYAHETYLVWIDDIAANRAARGTNFADARQIFTAYLPALLRDMSMGQRAHVAGSFFTKGPGFARRFTTATCEAAAETARRLRLSEGTQRGLHEVFEWWNGKGAPRGLKGDDIALVGRVAHVAGVAAEGEALGGPQVAVEAVRQRAGRILDPAIADVFATSAQELLEAARRDDPRACLLADEPHPVLTVSHVRLPEVAAAFGDIADLKTPYTHAHSAGVAHLAREAGHRLGLVEGTLSQLEVAARLHDVGRIAVPDCVWEKPGALTSGEWEQVRLHPYHTERVLSCSPVLAPMALIAGMHHERLDGSGYHRGCTGREISVPARILAAADVFQAATEPRPHRPGMTVARAAEQISREAIAGRLDADAVAAVVEAAGATRPSRALLRPAGLSNREVEVLRLVTRGLSNREIARLLYISPRTAEHHVQHVYGKIGVSSRAAAALFAMEHALYP